MEDAPPYPWAVLLSVDEEEHLAKYRKLTLEDQRQVDTIIDLITESAYTGSELSNQEKRHLAKYRKLTLEDQQQLDMIAETFLSKDIYKSDKKIESA